MVAISPVVPPSEPPHEELKPPFSANRFPFLQRIVRSSADWRAACGGWKQKTGNETEELKLRKEFREGEGERGGGRGQCTMYKWCVCNMRSTCTKLGVGSCRVRLVDTQTLTILIFLFFSSP